MCLYVWRAGLISVSENRLIPRESLTSWVFEPSGKTTYIACSLMLCASQSPQRQGSGLWIQSAKNHQNEHCDISYIDTKRLHQTFSYSTIQSGHVSNDWSLQFYDLHKFVKPEYISFWNVFVFYFCVFTPILHFATLSEWNSVSHSGIWHTKNSWKIRKGKYTAKEKSSTKKRTGIALTAVRNSGSLKKWRLTTSFPFPSKGETTLTTCSRLAWPATRKKEP